VLKCQAPTGEARRARNIWRTSGRHEEPQQSPFSNKTNWTLRKVYEEDPAVGQRIRQDILKEKRADYGAQIVAVLGRQLTTGFGRGFSRQNLFNTVRFAEVFPDPQIVQPVAAQFGLGRTLRAGRGFEAFTQRMADSRSIPRTTDGAGVCAVLASGPRIINYCE